MDWDRLFKKYVWDDVRTPYFFTVSKLSKAQAKYEIFTYTLFMGVLFGAVALISLAPNAPYGRSVGVSFYAMTVACAALIFGMTKLYWAVLYLSAAPLSLFVFFYTFGFAPKMSVFDKIFLLAFVVLWLRYSWRIVTIGKNYEDFPERGSGS